MNSDDFMVLRISVDIWYFLMVMVGAFLFIVFVEFYKQVSYQSLFRTPLLKVYIFLFFIHFRFL